MTPKQFTDNHLVNLSDEQLREIFDWEEIQKLPNNEIERQRIFWLSQYMVGNVSEPFEEIQKLEKADKRRVLETWADVIKDQQTLKVLVKSIACELMA
jgi:hypothetical protein